MLQIAGSEHNLFTLQQTSLARCCNIFYFIKDNIMWTTPAATEMRFGFEVTMYVMNK